MARSRKHGEDLTYGEWHRNKLPELYGRIGHRLDMANRDWTEYCHYCKTPLAIIEEVRDVGQDLRDKGVSVTRNLVKLTNGRVGAWLMAWRTERPASVQAEIDKLNARLRELEAAYPITGFTALNLTEGRAQLVHLTEDQWREHLLIIHRDHHARCSRRVEWSVDLERLHEAKERHPLHSLTALDYLPGTNLVTLEEARRRRAV